MTSEWKPDLRGNSHEIKEYLEDQGVYDTFDYLLKEPRASCRVVYCMYDPALQAPPLPPPTGYGSPRPPCGWGWVPLPPVRAGCVSVCGAGPPASGWTQPIWGGGGPRGRRPGSCIQCIMRRFHRPSKDTFLCKNV